MNCFGSNKEISQTTIRKRNELLQKMLVVASLIVMVILFVPIGLIGEAEKQLGNRGLLSNGFFKEFWLPPTFQALLFSHWVAIAFLAIGLLIVAADRNLLGCSALKKNIVNPLLVLYIILILASALLCLVLGGVMSGFDTTTSVRRRWLEDSNIAEALRTEFIARENCCGWDDIFEYQLQPECDRAQLLANPSTCQAALESLIKSYTDPIADWCMAAGVLLFIPWFITLGLRTAKNEVLGFWNR